MVTNGEIAGNSWARVGRYGTGAGTRYALLPVTSTLSSRMHRVPPAVRAPRRGTRSPRGTRVKQGPWRSNQILSLTFMTPSGASRCGFAGFRPQSKRLSSSNATACQSQRHGILHLLLEAR